MSFPWPATAGTVRMSAATADLLPGKTVQAITLPDVGKGQIDHQVGMHLF